MQLTIECDAALRNKAEADFVKRVCEVAQATCDRHDLNVSHVRFARKVKCFGAETYNQHLYTYRGGKVELWVNLDCSALDEPTAQSLKRFLLRTTRVAAFNNGLAVDFTPADVDAYFAGRPMPEGATLPAKFTKKQKMMFASHRWANAQA